MLTKSIAIDTANQFIRVLKENGFNPQQAYLFGSAVTGELHEYSDIDLAVWDEKFIGAAHIDLLKVLKLMRPFASIELHPYNISATEESNPFIEVIKRTGLELNVNEI
jgi:predicted nucleotidyltransferase